MGSNTYKKEKLENDITVKIQDRIVQLGLVDTGLMRDSVHCILRDTGDGFVVDVYGVNYMSILDAQYGFINYVINDDVIINNIIDIYGDMIVSYLKED